MGCDIHTVAQVYQNGKWDTVAENIGDEDRSYASFAIMANVRNSNKWQYISQPRGIPDDFNDHPINDCFHYRILLPLNLGKWLGDHSHSWLLLSEMVDFLENKIESVPGATPPEYFMKCINELREIMAEYAVTSDHVRLVFGFDS